MKERINKLKQQEQEQSLTQEQALQQQRALEFGSPEEMLRYDAAQTEVPPRIGQRLERTLGSEPKPGRSWWRRLFRRSP